MSDRFKNLSGFGKRMQPAVKQALEIQNRLKVDEPKPIKFTELRNHQLADYQYEILVRSIKEFESELDDDHEVAVKLSAFGQSIMMQVVEIGYSNPTLIHFYGYVNGSKSELIQHVNQLSFLLMVVPKADPVLPARRIGFLTPDDVGQEQE